MPIDNRHGPTNDVASKFSVDDLMEMNEVEAISNSLNMMVVHYTEKLGRPREYILSALLYDVLNKIISENNLNREEASGLFEFAASLIYEPEQE